MVEIAEIKDNLNKLQTSMAVMQSSIDRQNETLDKLTEAFSQLSIYVEKTNQNDEKINILFKKLDTVYENGTRNCPIHTEKMTAFEKELKRQSARLDNLQKVLVGFAVGVGMQFFGIIIYMIEKHII